jgi:hypothetical protein
MRQNSATKNDKGLIEFIVLIYSGLQLAAGDWQFTFKVYSEAN